MTRRGKGTGGGGRKKGGAETHLHWYSRSISSYLRRGRFFTAFPGRETNEYVLLLLFPPGRGVALALGGGRPAESADGSACCFDGDGRGCVGGDGRPVDAEERVAGCCGGCVIC